MRAVVDGSYVRWPCNSLMVILSTTMLECTLHPSLLFMLLLLKTPHSWELFAVFSYTLLYICHIVHSTLTVRYWKLHSETTTSLFMPSPNTHIHHPTVSTPTPLHPCTPTHPTNIHSSHTTHSRGVYRDGPTHQASIPTIPNTHPQSLLSMLLPPGSVRGGPLQQIPLVSLPSVITVQSSSF